jgi:type IV pilus assembly protein PilN
MIRINLLPKKVSKKKMGLLQHLIFTAALFAVLLIGIGYFWVSLNGKVSDLRRQVTVAAAEKERLKDVNTQKNTYEKNIAKLKNKLDIITQIQEARFLPIRLFDEMTLVLDRDTPVWLNKLAMEKDRISIEGYSLSNPDLANFVTKLENTPFYKNVDLIYSEKVVKDKREIFQFSLEAMPQTEDDAPDTKPSE